MYIKIVTHEYTDKYRKYTYKKGERYFNTNPELDCPFNFISKEEVFKAYCDYFLHLYLEEVRFMEIEPLDEDFEKGNYEFGRSSSYGILVIREVPLEEVLTVEQIESINNCHSKK